MSLSVLSLIVIKPIFFLNLYCDRVHVVFGLVISGFEVIEQIENLKTDAASRPYADVRVIDCGVLATKSTKDGKSFWGWR
jgi:cyclophilin family peptidyl-prolyl cis-trans isomerase